MLDREWRCEIVPTGRWSWSFHITHGCTIVGEPGAFVSYGSRERAERKARKILAKLQAIAQALVLVSDGEEQRDFIGDFERAQIDGSGGGS